VPVQVFTGKATNPTPIDHSTIEETSVLLDWWSARRAEEDWAISDRVYLSTDRDAVVNGDASVKIGEPVISELEVQDLIPGSTYYWRVDEVYADGQVIPGYIWQFLVTSKKATAPVPADGTLYADPNIVLSWTAGLGAQSHVVHIGTDQSAVANAVIGDGVLVIGTTYSPGPLNLETTYYWRVDEVGKGLFLGDVWSFTTGPDIPVTDPDLVGYWTLDETPDDFIIDDSGHHHHGQVVGGPTLVDDVVGGKALEFNGQNQFCKLGNWLPSQNQLTVALRVKWAGSTGVSQGLIAKRNTWTVSMWTLWAQENGQIVFEINKNEVLSESMAMDTWEHWAVTVGGASGQTVIYRDGLQVASGWQDSFSDNPTTNLVLGAMEFTGDACRNPFNGALDDVRIYSKVLTAAEIQQLSRIDLNQAWNPTPSSGAASNLGLGQNTVLLSWSAGEKAAQHKVLFGSEPNALVELGTVSEPSIVSPVVDVNGTYFWQVDEINTDGTVTEGPVWKLVIADCVLVDDFEGYIDDAIWFTWSDGFGWKEPAPGSTGNGTGSMVDINDVALSGDYSMSIAYDNTGTGSNIHGDPITATYSETQRTWASPQDLTQGGYNALVLSVHGSSGNAAAPLYVVLESAGQSAVIYHELPDTVVLTDGWKEWAIKLAGITSVDLTAVTKMVIGVGDASAAGGSGTLLVDQIVLVNYVFVEPAEPDSAALAGQWNFEGNFEDSSGNARHGTAMGEPNFVAGKVGQAISLDGIGDYVEITGYKGILGPNAVTVTAWINTISTETGTIVNWGTQSNGQRVDFRVNADRLRVEHGGGNIQGDTNVNDGSWHHVAVTVQENATISYPEVILYLDGIDDTRPGTDPDMFNIIANVDVSIGYRATNNDRFFMGQIDDVRIYDYALSRAEVGWLAGLTKPF